ncbi:peptidyl-tRNA hydrolase [Pneumocystis carinii B80]|uniref:Peptidyl-tRNA hydrolase n=1 Tax=Pneumocystis carinii (strain B80) TaxID=1408658 RepID=A0A0W4ZKJ6_PNEC8|nr:peptidyl-tRNA hydrolase [Pneumocystis carinii B80]KTW28875.1 peptidyl-tRNA hydrolase [Pneumocystis carinii B80]
MRGEFGGIQRILISSIGNPGSAYRFTRHNLGHYVLEEIRKYFGFSVFKRDSLVFGSYAEKRDSPFLLFRSDIYMNESGLAVYKAWSKFCENKGVNERKNCYLVVIHDDIEENFGVLKVKNSGKGRGNRGHNGIRSCIASLGTESFIRFSIGLGRPSTRESKDVINFVMENLSEQELSYVNERTIPDVVKEIYKLTEEIKSY